MFFLNQSRNHQLQYLEFLEIVGSLSNLFSDSQTPYLNYRVAEKVFCRAFLADDLSRSDVSADAKKDQIGIGLKTFLIGNSKSFQKVAEFNSDRLTYTDLPPEKMIKKIAELRNARIRFTENTFELDRSIYHCIVRDKGNFNIFEEEMSYIDIEKIKLGKQSYCT